MTDKTSAAPVMWRFDPSVIDYDQYRDRLRAMSPYRMDGSVDENILADMMLLLNDIERGKHLPTPDVVGGDGITDASLAAEWANIHEAESNRYLVNQSFTNARRHREIANALRRFSVPRVQGDADHAELARRLRLAAKPLFRERVTFAEDLDTLTEVIAALETLAAQTKGDDIFVQAAAKSPKEFQVKPHPAEQTRGEPGFFETIWKEATDLGVIDRKAAQFVWHSAMGYARAYAQPNPEQTRGNGANIARQIRGSIIRRLDAFHESNPSSWCGYLDDALGAAEVIAENLESSVAPRQAAPDGWLSALDAAVSAIYFDDSSDYLRALWTVVRSLRPDIADKLERYEHDAYAEVKAMIASAPSAGRMGVDRG